MPPAERTTVYACIIYIYASRAQRVKSDCAGALSWLSRDVGVRVVACCELLPATCASTVSLVAILENRHVDEVLQVLI